MKLEKQLEDLEALSDAVHRLGEQIDGSRDTTPTADAWLAVDNACTVIEDAKRRAGHSPRGRYLAIAATKLEEAQLMLLRAECEVE